MPPSNRFRSGSASTRRQFISLLAAGGAAFAEQGRACAATQTLAVKADMVYPISGAPIKNGVILIRGGKIVAMGQGLSIPSGAKLLRAASVMPGLVDPHSYLGVYGSNTEPVDAVTPDFITSDAFNPADIHLNSALGEGVTSALVAPANTGVFGGQAGVVHLGIAHQVVALYAAQKMSVSADAANAERNPTSRAGAVQLFGSALEAAKRGMGVSSTTQTTPLIGEPSGLTLRAAALRPLLAGSVPGLFHAPKSEDAEIALDLMARYHLKGALLHTSETYRIAGKIAVSGAGVILSPLSLTDTDRTLSSAAALSKAGVKVAFCSDAPLTHPEALRRSICLAAAYGLPEAAALAAITQSAAQLAGVSGAGALKVGGMADLLLLDGSPLELSSRTIGVVSRGSVVVGGVA
jgi:imidazolonepropionase-like amidohydrolase